MTKQDRLIINCGIVLQGPAADIDGLLAEVQSRGLTICYKRVSLGKLWIKEGESKE